MSATSRPEVELPDFDALYREAGDPWRVQSSWYERRKLDILLASLPRERYSSIWEPGCGPGFVSARLAERTDRLVATDASAVAITHAEARLAQSTNITFEIVELPETPETDPVELVVVAEFLYYVADLEAALGSIWRKVRPGGQAAFVHWVHHPDDAYRSGRDMHVSIALDATARGAVRIVTHLDVDFQLDIYEVAP
jgi:SAM-dependent methyltransferase